ncbi:MAG: hypothetical protein QXK49_00065 [Candidatus Aenigmatarchaeota archaeon]
MTECKPYEVIKYNPNGPIDPEWDLSIKRAIWRAELIGDLKTAQSNSIARIALKNALDF